MIGNSLTARLINAAIFEPRKPIPSAPKIIPTFSPWSGQYVYIEKPVEPQRARAAAE